MESSSPRIYTCAVLKTLYVLRLTTPSRSSAPCTCCFLRDLIIRLDNPLPQVWSPTGFAGYRVLVNSNNSTERRSAFQRAIVARKTASTGLTVMGYDWVVRGITRVSTMLVTPLYWTPHPLVAGGSAESTRLAAADEEHAQQEALAAPGPVGGAAPASSSLSASRVSSAADPNDPEAVLTGFLDINFAWATVRLLRPGRRLVKNVLRTPWVSGGSRRPCRMLLFSARTPPQAISCHCKEITDSRRWSPLAPPFISQEGLLQPTTNMPFLPRAPVPPPPPAQMLTPVVSSFCDVHILLHSTAPNVDLSRGLPEGVAGADTSLYTLEVSNGEARDVGWGDLRRPSDRLRRFERSFNVSVGPTVFTVTVRQSCFISGSCSFSQANLFSSKIKRATPQMTAR